MAKSWLPPKGDRGQRFLVDEEVNGLLGGFEKIPFDQAEPVVATRELLDAPTVTVVSVS